MAARHYMARRLLLPALAIAFSYWNFGCSNLAYQPSRQQFGYPERAKIHYEKVDFKSRDGTSLTGWLFPAVTPFGKEPTPTVIQFHGNAENMTSHFYSLYWLIEAGFNVFTFDYRGYGRSTGSPSPEGVNLDVLAAIDFIRSRIPASKGARDLVLYGQSLGGAGIARDFLDLEDRTRLSAVIIEGSFHSYREVGQDILTRTWITFPFQHLPYLLMSKRFSPEDSISRISPIPLLVIHGDKDRVIPPRFGKRIFELAGAPKEFWLVEGGQHLDSMFRNQGEYRVRLVEWLRKNRLR